MKAEEPVTSATSCIACGSTLRAARCGHCGAMAAVRGYQVRRVLAQQPHSRVYLAAPPEGPAVVLKELTFSLVPDIQTLEAFQREAGLLRQLSHPRLPTFLESFQEGTGVGTRLYLAMTYVEGHSLQDALRAHRFSEAEALDIAARALELLVYLHGLSPPVIHRDVKPANLLRQPDGTLSLVDFGAAREVRRATAGQSTLVGTVGYMPPEQLAGVTTPGGDVYALGATLVHLLSRTSPGELMGPDLRLEFEPRVNLGAPALEWLTKLVHRQPRRRFASAAQALEALHAVRSGKAGRRRVRRAVGQGLGLAALAVGGWVALRSLDRRAVAPPPLASTTGAALAPRITCPAGTTLAEDLAQRTRWCSRPDASGHPVRHGPFVRWDARGALTERGGYADGALHGPQVLMQDGRTLSEGAWRQGKKTGPWVSYRNLDGYKKGREATYKDDVLDGPFRHFGDDGALEDEGPYTDGLKHGVWSHYRGRDKAYEATFVRDTLSGPYTSWHPNSESIHEQGHYVDGHRTGLWRAYYDGHGQKQAEGSYEADQRHGVWRTWHPNGQRADQGAYVNGQKQGPWVTWFETGQKRDAGAYDHGQPVGTWLSWHDGGGKRSEVSHEPGGWVRTTEWFTNGQMASRGATRDSLKEGPWTTWHPNGQKKSFSVYVGGEHEGLATAWHPNGSKEFEGQVVLGRPTGTWRWWRDDGTLEREEKSRP